MLNNRIIRILEIIAAIATIIGMCIATISLIPAFGQWLFPIMSKPTDSVVPSTPTLGLPTNELLPTNTVVVAPTEVPPTPPADGILFQDNFDNGIKPDWHIYSGKWIVVDGKLTTLTPEHAFSDILDQISIGDSSWKNYIVSVTVNISYGFTTTIAVRTNLINTRAVGLSIDRFDYMYMALLQGDWSIQPIAGKNENTSFPRREDVKIEIEVKDNTYIVRVGGRQLQEAILSDYSDGGGVILGTFCDPSSLTSECTTFDDFKVSFLP